MIFTKYPRFFVNSRAFKTLNFGGTREVVAERSDFPLNKVKNFFKNDTFCVLGYGSQGRAQALNLKDSGFNVVLGLRDINLESRTSPSIKKAKEDGFDKIYSIEEACDRGNIVMNLLSDAGQRNTWHIVNKYLTKGKTLYFSHGFSVVYNDQTKVIPPKNIDVIMVAPKASGTTLRNKFLAGKGVNSSYAVFQNYSDTANYKAQSIGFAIGSNYLYETTFKKEVYSDLVGERGVLMGAIHGLILAQYEVLRSKGHSPSEAFNETVEELTQSLIPLIDEKGMDWMYNNCSITARIGAVSWYPKFKDAVMPLMKELYERVEKGDETREVLSKDKEFLDKEIAKISQMEIWTTGKTVRDLRK